MAKKIALLDETTQYTPYQLKIYKENNWNNYKVYTRIGNEWKLCSYETTQNQTVTHSYPVLYNENGHGIPPASQTKIENVTLKLQPFISIVTEGEGTQTFTVYANANGGTWSGSNGSATYSPISHTYTQTAWYTNSSGTGGTSYASQANYTVNAPVTLYAIWNETQGSASYTYTLPTGTPTKTSLVNYRTVTYNYGDNASGDKYDDQSLQIISYSFKGWYTASTGGTQRTTSSQVTSDETVYAQYNTTTGSWSAITLPTVAQCHKEGYTLLGFSTTSGATTITSGLTPGASYTPSNSIILYAVWQQSNQTTYTISYNRNSHGGTAPASQTKIKDESLILRPFMDSSLEGGSTSNYIITGNANGGTWSGSNGSATYTTSQINYIQTAWNTNSNGTGTSYGDQGVYTANASATLYAKWNNTTVSQASYTYNLPSGTPTKASEVGATKTVIIDLKGGTYNNSTTNPSFSVNKMRDYSFTGWYTAATGGTQRTSQSQVTASEIVYAHYDYTLSQAMFSMQSFPDIILPSDITKDSYIFMGYDTSSDATNIVYVPGDTYSSDGTTETVTLYCVWVLDTGANTYLIQYNKNNSNHMGSAPNSQTKTHDEPLTLRPFMSDTGFMGVTNTYTITGDVNGGVWPSGAVAFMKRGSATYTPGDITYTQLSWNTNINGTGDSYISEGIYTKNEAATMYAQWSSSQEPDNYTYSVPPAIPTYPATSYTTVTWLTINGNGATFASNNSTTKTYTESRPDDEGMFEGWYTASTGGIKRDSNSQVQAAETVYAHYIPAPQLAIYSVTLPPASSYNLYVGYELYGYSTTSVCLPQNVEYEPGETITIHDENMVLYAIWLPEGTGTPPPQTLDQFTVGTDTYYFEPGMTFAEWQASNYNTDNLRIYGNFIGYPSAVIGNNTVWQMIGSSRTIKVLKTATIGADLMYVWVSYTVSGADS